MNQHLHSVKSFALIAMISLLTACSNDNNMPTIDQEIPMPGIPPSVEFTALSKDNKIYYYNATNLNMPIKNYSITGLAQGETIISIDYRPATGQLYGLGSSSKLYLINENSGMATALGTTAFTPQIEGTSSSIDFNPTVDRIRLVSNNGQNLRLHPELGTVAVIDGSINGVANTKIEASAYTNSFSGATSTQLYNIDYATDKLYLQVPPNDGTLQEVGSLMVDFEGSGGFDIMADSNYAMAVNNKDNESRLYSINLENGKASWVGTFTQQIIEVAFKTKPIAYATTADNTLYRVNPETGTSNSVALMGMNADEKIVGLDFRPMNGSLYAITNQSRLITINPSNGQVTAKGTGLSPMLSGENFGFDFNPTVDRIRVVSNTGQNLRLHPDLGTVAVTDGMLNPGTPSISAAAYTNSFAQSTTTQLYVIDSSNNNLYLQSPPNDGTLVLVGNLGVTANAMNGFDIGGTSNEAIALLSVNNMQAFYKINLSNGSVSKTANFNQSITAMTMGLGF